MGFRHGHPKRSGPASHSSYERAREWAVGRYQVRPAFRVTLRRWGPTVVLELHGPLTIETRVPLADLTEWMTCRGHSQLFLDLSGVTRMDCSGIGQLVGLREKVRHLGGRLALVSVASRQKHLLDVAGLLAVIPVFECPQTAFSRIDDYDVA
jgi:anti-sigma B factor antagonist